MSQHPIGIFDSGYGGLTVLSAIRQKLPEYDYVYLGDNARTPYGNRSFEVIHTYTLEAVKTLFDMGCELVILACNTASAKALRTIQQRDLSAIDPNKRVLGVIRPSTEMVGTLSKTGHVGIFGTEGTVRSESYVIEIGKFFPDLVVHQESCPIWVPLIENQLYDTPGGEYFIQHHVDALMAQDPDIDTVVLGCTHYPIIEQQIRKALPEHVHVVSQGDIVANSLADYLDRHSDMAARCTKSGTLDVYTTENAAVFSAKASAFLGDPIAAKHVILGN